MMATTQLTLTDATLAFDGIRRLGPLSLSLPLNGLTAVLGPNGAGKSLFLGLCHGMMPPDSGAVQWNGQSAMASRAARGFMLQTSVVLRRTVAANIDFALQSHGVSPAARASKTANALALARLTDKATAPAATLSGGEMRRMNLARALVTDPEVLLLDEPFAGLDPAATQAMETIITEIAQNTPVLMSHHDLVQTRRIATRVLFFNEGKLQENALASDFFLGPQTEQARTFLQGQLL